MDVRSLTVKNEVSPVLPITEKQIAHLLTAQTPRTFAWLMCACSDYLKVVGFHRQSYAVYNTIRISLIVIFLKAGKHPAHMLYRGICPLLLPT